MHDSLRDGTVIQDGLRFHARNPYPSETVRRITYPVIGQIYNVVAPDGDENYAQETYLCDVHVTELGIDLFQVPWTLDKAGPDNYVHYGPVAATANLDQSPFNKQLLTPKVSNGDTVMVVFAYGDVHKPYIIRVLPHNQSGPMGMSPSPRPTGDDGDCYKVRFNGTNLVIDKDGNLTIENTDALNPDTPRQKVFTINWNNADGDANVIVIDMNEGAEAITVDHATGSFIHLDPDGSVDIQSSDGDEVLVSPSEGVQISTPANGGTSASFKNGQVDITAGQGVSIDAMGGPFDITVDGDYEITSTSGGVTIDAQGGDFKATDAGGAEVNLSGGKPAVGNAAIEAFDLISQILNMMATATFPGFGAPGSFAPAAATLQATVDANKGSL